MNFNNKEFILLSKEQVFGDNKLNIFEKVGTKCAVTDFAVALGSYVSNFHVDKVNYDTYNKSRTGSYFLLDTDDNGEVYFVNTDGCESVQKARFRNCGIRPVLHFSSFSNSSLNNILNTIKKNNDLLEVEFGEYPQYVVDEILEIELEQAYRSGTIRKTGKIYTTDSRKWDDWDLPFQAIKYEEYEHKGKRYVRTMYTNDNIVEKKLEFSNGLYYKKGNYVWLEVSPLKWYVDNDAEILISKNIIASGIRFCAEEKYDADFKNTEMYNFLNTYFAKDIIPSEILQMTPEEKKNLKEKQKRRRNPYGFKFDSVKEEDIIKGAVESGIAVFLHGPSSEGKSARVKQIDPDCTIIYLRNATPDSLNGKSVYDSIKGEMLDIKPTWLKKLETKCEKEPDKLHIVFFDELTNALPSIQGMAFNIVLDREVNGIWKLPNNARIVAAGNEMNDSLSANQLAEPLFNRFAHVYIKTTPEDWLRWASENNIHPAIYSYIAYKKGETLRSKYNGIKPNADPRKWEMASKMLYATGNPEMLRALIGEDITREFVKFCSSQVITLEDVLNDNYSESDIELLNTASKYATTMGLSQVDEENMPKVRDFVLKLGAEYGAIFDTLWAHNDEARLELIAESRLTRIRGKYE